MQLFLQKCLFFPFSYCLEDFDQVKTAKVLAFTAKYTEEVHRGCRSPDVGCSWVLELVRDGKFRLKTALRAVKETHQNIVTRYLPQNVIYFDHPAPHLPRLVPWKDRHPANTTGKPQTRFNDYQPHDPPSHPGILLTSHPGTMSEETCSRPSHRTRP